VAVCLSEIVTVPFNIKLECDFHRCWTLFGRSPEIVKSRMIRWVEHVDEMRKAYRRLVQKPESEDVEG
jgi:hypothetical protein